MKTSIWTLLLGLLMIAAGVLALINPFPASLAVTIFAGWSFIILGILQIISGIRDTSGGTRILLVIIGAIMVWIGWEVLGNPIGGLLALAIAVAISFVASGVAKSSSASSSLGRASVSGSSCQAPFLWRLAFCSSATSWAPRPGCWASCLGSN